MSGADDLAGLVIMCNKCGQKFDRLDGLRLHLCPYWAAKARGFTPLQAVMEAEIRVAEIESEISVAAKAADEAIARAAERAKRSADRAAKAAEREIAKATAPASRTMAAVQAVDDNAHANPQRSVSSVRILQQSSAPSPKKTRQPTASSVRISQQAKPRRASAEVQADKAAKALQRQAKATRRAIEAADDYTPDPLPDSGAVPIHGPLPVANPSHPVRNRVKAARWQRTSSEPASHVRYCACGLALPSRPGPKCENCGRTIKPDNVRFDSETSTR